jgi:predicted DNA-binding transcriptional regulator AlpA
MSNRKHALTRLPPAVEKGLDELQRAVRVLGEEIGVALAAYQREDEQQQQQQEAERTPERNTKEIIIEEASPTKCYRAKEVARRLAIDPQTLWRWVREKRFPAGIKAGPMTTVWSEVQIAEWLEQQRGKEHRPPRTWSPEVKASISRKMKASWERRRRAQE